MSTLNELKAAMADRAQRVTGDVDTLMVGVHSQIQTIRQRRTTAIVALAATVVAAVTFGWLNLPGREGKELRPQPVSPDYLRSPELIEQDGFFYPSWVMVDGLVYEQSGFSYGSNGTSRITTFRFRSKESGLVMWGTSTATEGTLTVDGKEQPITGEDFLDYVFLPPKDGKTTVTVEAPEGKVYQVDYKLNTRATQGLSTKGLTLRESNLPWRMLGAEVGDLWEKELTFEFTVPRHPVGWVVGCRKVEDGTRPKLPLASLQIDGVEVASTQCRRSSGFEDLSNAITSSDDGTLSTSERTYQSGDTVTATVSLPDSAPDVQYLQLAAGFYELVDPDAQANVKEVAGHRYERQVELMAEPAESGVESTDDRAEIKAVYRLPEITRPTIACPSFPEGEYSWRMQIDGEREVSAGRSEASETGVTRCSEVIYPGDAKLTLLASADGGAEPSIPDISLWAEPALTPVQVVGSGHAEP
jgi:hypothetical protein